jgi:hypothetical protein
MRRGFALVVVGVVLGSLTTAFGVSDGNYDPARMHCSGRAERAIEPDYVEDGCHNFTVTISDVSGHEYFGFGTPQTKVGEQGSIPEILPFGIGGNVHEIEWWYDLGDGCTRFSEDFAAPGPPVQDECPWFDPTAPNYYGPSPEPDPASGLKIYFGADDNLAGGEHDSSYLINNGPSDGGGIRVELDPATIQPWVDAIAAGDAAGFLTHPLPLLDAGTGFCADSICFSIQTSRHVAYQGGNTGEPSPSPSPSPGHGKGKGPKCHPKRDGVGDCVDGGGNSGGAEPPHRSLANYSGKNWDPESCSGANDANTADCDDPSTDGTTEDITYWHNQEGTVYADPGVQIYADPDPQGSPIGPYPLPALYVGTCGIIIGGGDVQFPDSPFTNDAGQLVIETGCG